MGKRRRISFKTGTERAGWERQQCVAKVLKSLGGDVQATGFLGGYNGIAIRTGLEERGISSPFLFTDGESRICLNIIDESNGSSTELLESGPQINHLHIQQMIGHLRELASLSTG